MVLLKGKIAHDTSVLRALMVNKGGRKIKVPPFHFWNNVVEVTKLLLPWN